MSTSCNVILMVLFVEMYTINMVLSCFLYSAVSLIHVRKGHSIRIIYYHYYTSSHFRTGKSFVNGSDLICALFHRW